MKVFDVRTVQTTVDDNIGDWIDEVWYITAAEGRKPTGHRKTDVTELSIRLREVIIIPKK